MKMMTVLFMAAALLWAGNLRASMVADYTAPETYSASPDLATASMVWNLDRESISVTPGLNLPTNIAAAVTDNPQQQTAFDNAWTDLLGGAVTNVSADVYGTYAPKAPAGNSKFGGGLCVVYNFNSYVGAGLGADWLGQFALVSGDMQFQAPIHLTTIAPIFGSVAWLQSAEIVPFAIVGAATPYSGNGKFNGSPMAVSDVGAYLAFGHLWGGQFNAGVAWGKWVGQGQYGDVTRYHAFFGYIKNWGK